MVRKTGSHHETTWPVVREAAIQLIFENGYEVANTRMLAERVGMKPGSLYYYFTSKEELLYRITSELMQALLDDVQQRLAVTTGALERLDVYVATVVEWHVLRNRESFIARMEVRSLSAEKHAKHLELRRSFSRILRDILLKCERERVIKEEDRRLHELSIMTMLSGITSWYRPDGAKSLAQLQAYYKETVRRMLDVSTES